MPPGRTRVQQPTKIPAARRTDVTTLVAARKRRTAEASDPLDRIAYRISEAAEVVGCSKSTLYNAINARELEFFRLPGSMRIARAALERYVAR